MATEKEKETTKRTSTKKGGIAESAEKKAPQKKRTTKPKDPPRKTATKSVKTAGKKTPAAKSKPTKSTKAATPKTAAKPRSNVKTAPSAPSVTQPTEEQTAAAAATDATPVADRAPGTPPASQGPTPQTPAPAAEKTSPPPAEDTAAPPTDIPPPSGAAESDPAGTDAGRTQPPRPPEPPAAAENGRNVSLTVYLGLGLLIVVSLIVFASLFNMNHYYLKHHNGALEIWRGKFSPKGIERLVIMPGVAPPEEIKPVYTREEVYPIALQYYIDKADTLMEVSGLPDFKGIKADLKRADSYALDDAQRQMVQERLNRIDLTALLYKADVAAGKGSLDDLNMAKKYLNQAAQHNPDEFEAKLIAQKLASIDALMAAITRVPAVPTPPEPEAATDTEIPADDASSQPQSQPETTEAPKPPTQHSESQ